MGGRSLDFKENKRGGSVVTENPKGGITENFGLRGRTTQICLGGGGIAKVIKCY